MKLRILNAVSIGAAVAAAICAQGLSRQAVITGGGSPDRGKCTVEVAVDGAAQVEIRANTATLKDLSGRPPQWRRFECTSPMPPNPANFRFAGVDGRGRQQLIRDPRNGGVAVVQIEDSQGGAEGYTFDIFWDTGTAGGQRTDNRYQPGYPVQQPNYPNRERSEPPVNGGYRDRDYEGYRPDYRNSEYYGRYGHGFGTDEAVRVCQDAVAQQAVRRFGRADVHFHGTRIDDNPGRNDWVIGTLDVHRGPREERFRFSCSVNFDTGRVRSADLDSRPLLDDPRWH